MAFTKFFDGDVYADDDPVCRGVSVSSLPLAGAFRDPLPSPWAIEKDQATPCSWEVPPPLFLGERQKAPTSEAASECETECEFAVRAGRPTVRMVGTPEQLRHRLVEQLRCAGEVVVRLKEKPGVWKAKVQLFSDERYEQLTVGLRVSSVGGGVAVAEWCRQRGDCLLFQNVFRQAKEAVEGYGMPVRADPEFPPADVHHLQDLIALAEVCPEEAVAALARLMDHLTDDEVASVQVDVASWLCSNEVGVVGAACAVAARLHAPVRTVALDQALQRLRRSDTLAGKLLLRLVLALPTDEALPTDALRDAGAGLDAETRQYIKAICCA